MISKKNDLVIINKKINMKSENDLEKLIKTLKIITTIDNIDFSYKSEKYHDHYYLNIKMVRKHSNSEAMMIIEEDIANMRLKIIIRFNVKKKVLFHPTMVYFLKNDIMIVVS